VRERRGTSAIRVPRKEVHATFSRFERVSGFRRRGEAGSDRRRVDSGRVAPVLFPTAEAWAAIAALEATVDQLERMRRPGGTPGGLGSFLLGGILTAAGGYLLLNQVQVYGGYWRWWGNNTFGLTLVPLLLGIGILFFNGKSIPGWLLAIAGLAIIFAGVLSSMEIYFRATSLYNVLIMLVLLVGGLGLMARALR
jgi:hypothetical protein